MFEDRWLDKEDNARLMDVLFKWLRPGMGPPPLDPHDAEEPDISDMKLLPDTQSLADRLKACLQVGQPFALSLWLSHEWGEVVALQMGVCHAGMLSACVNDQGRCWTSQPQASAARAL